jgi:hypothetical protein
LRIELLEFTDELCQHFDEAQFDRRDVVLAYRRGHPHAARPPDEPRMGSNSTAVPNDDLDRLCRTR